MPTASPSDIARRLPIPRRHPLELLRQEIDHHPHLGTEVAAAGVDGEHVDVGHAVAGQQGHEATGAQVLADQKVGLPDDAGAGQCGGAGGVAVVVEEEAATADGGRCLVAAAALLKTR